MFLAAFAIPTISPLQVSIASGGQLNLNCSAEKFDGNAILLYRILVNSSVIKEATDPETLTDYAINPVNSTNTGSYTCRTSLASNLNIRRLSDNSSSVIGKKLFELIEFECFHPM